MDINKRIITLIEILGLSPGEFADKINVQRSGISHITSGRNKPSLDFLERTLSVFPEINTEWLILGKGKPLKSQIETEKEEVKVFSDDKNENPLLFPMEDFIEEPVAESKVESTSSERKHIELENKENRAYKEEDDEKKEIKKIIILYKDHSFEVFES